MTARNATVAVIGAGDFIGAAIARKFAAEGFTVFAGRRNGDKLAPLIADIEKAGGRVFGRSLDARKEEDITAFLQEADRAGAARGLHLQHRRQRQLPDPRHDRARLPQGLGDGLLLGLPRRPRGRAPDAAARQGLHLLHRRHRQHARRHRLRRLRRGQGRPARGRAGRRARARAEEHPRRAPGDRFRRRHRLGARAHQGARGRRGAGQPRPRPADAARGGRREPTGRSTSSRATPGARRWKSVPSARNGEPCPRSNSSSISAAPTPISATWSFPEIEKRQGVRFEYVPVLLGGVFKLTNNRSPAESQRRHQEQAGVPAARDRALHPPARHHALPAQPVLPGEHADDHARRRRGAEARHLRALCRRGLPAHVGRAQEARRSGGAARRAARIGRCRPTGCSSWRRRRRSRTALLAETQRAVDRGTFGSPTFFVDDEIYFGKDRLRDVEEAIAANRQARLDASSAVIPSRRRGTCPDA